MIDKALAPRMPAPPSLAGRLAMRARPERGGPLMHQSWRELLFLHWEVDAETLQSTLPPGLWVDRFEDKAYLGLVPFTLRAVRPRFFLSLPGISDFLELNIRTYVHDRHGTPGVWFYSLDANSWLAVEAARVAYHLPYQHAEMEAGAEESEEITYRCRRRATETAPSLFVYRKTGNLPQAKPGSLEFFLIERYVLFAQAKSTGRLYAARVWHTPYPLGSIELLTWDTRLFTLDGLPEPAEEPAHRIRSWGVDVEVFAPRPVA
jgi:uncharacterized protein YqjF (DUF2071 family)